MLQEFLHLRCKLELKALALTTKNLQLKLKTLQLTKQPKTL